MIGRASRKCTRFAETDTSGSSSAGKTALRIRPALAISEPAPSSSEAENQTQGKRPVTRKTAYGSVGTAPWPGLRMKPNTTP